MNVSTRLCPVRNHESLWQQKGNATEYWAIGAFLAGQTAMGRARLERLRIERRAVRSSNLDQLQSGRSANLPPSGLLIVVCSRREATCRGQCD